MNHRALIMSLVFAVFSFLHAESDLAQLVNTARQNDAVAVESLIHRSLDLREKILPFMSEADRSIKAHQGALPSTLSVKIAKSIREADAVRTRLFPYALRYRNALYRTDESLGDRDRIESIVISMAVALTL